MVRPDHEDGGVLSSAADDPTPEPSTEKAESPDSPGGDRKPLKRGVRKTSPLGRKRAAGTGTRPGRPGPAPAEESALAESPGEPGEPDEALADQPDVAPPAEPEESVPESEAADEPGESGRPVDEKAAVSYRDRRRRRAKKPAVDRDEEGSSSRPERPSADQPSPRTPKAAAPLRKSGAGRSRKFALIAYLVGVVVIVAGVVASVVFAVSTGRIDDERALRAEYETFARSVVVKMTTLDPGNADAIYKFTMEKTSGRAQQTFRDNMKQVAEMIRQGNEVTKTTILADAVTNATENDGTVIMVAGWENRSADKNAPPDFQTFRWKVDVTRINGELKLTNLEFVY